MLKNILNGAIILALSLGISYSSIAQPKQVKVDPPANEEAKTRLLNTSPDATETTDNLQKRIEMQVQRYTSDYNLTEKQQKDLTATLTDIESQLLELRNKQNSLNKEKADKIEALLTKEQKEMREQSLKERRDKMLEKRKEGKPDGEQIKPRMVNPQND